MRLASSTLPSQGEPENPDPEDAVRAAKIRLRQAETRKKWEPFQHHFN